MRSTRKMRSSKPFVATALLLMILIFALPSTTPRVYGAAAPCQPTPNSCGIAILSPGGSLNPNTNVNSSFIVSFTVWNFTLVQPGTGKPRIGSDVNTTTATGNEGHIHVWVDNVYVTIWASSDGIPLTLATGTHKIRLDLVNDFHQKFNPGINATATVNVANPLQSTASSAQSNASNAMTYGLGALIVSIIVLIVVAYNAFRPKPKTP